MLLVSLSRRKKPGLLLFSGIFMFCKICLVRFMTFCRFYESKTSLFLVREREIQIQIKIFSPCLLHLTSFASSKKNED